MTTDYPSDWDRRRKDVYERDGYTCQNCGRQGGPYGSAELHAHHIVPKSAGGTHKKSNLKTVCKACHQAIHGSSIAPSATSEQTPQQGHGVSLDVDEFPYAAAEFVEFGRQLEEIADRLETTGDSLDELLELLDMHVSLDSGERPPRFDEQYERRYQKTVEAIQALENGLDTLTQQRPDFSRSSSVEAYERFIEDASTSIALLREYHSSIAEIIESDEVSESGFAELQLLNTELDESIDAFVDSAASLMTATGDEIERVVNNLGQDTATFTGINPYDNCPICGATEAQMQTSNDLELVRCTECRTEFQSDSWFTWEVIHSSKPIEGISLTPEMWKAFDPEDPDDHERIEEFEQASEKHVKGTMGAIAAGFVTQVFGLIWGFGAGSFMIPVLAVVASLVVGIVGVKGVEAAVRP